MLCALVKTMSLGLHSTLISKSKSDLRNWQKKMKQKRKKNVPKKKLKEQRSVRF